MNSQFSSWYHVSLIGSRNHHHQLFDTLSFSDKYWHHSLLYPTPSLNFQPCDCLLSHLRDYLPAAIISKDYSLFYTLSPPNACKDNPCHIDWCAFLLSNYIFSWFSQSAASFCDQFRHHDQPENLHLLSIYDDQWRCHFEVKSHSLTR